MLEVPPFQPKPYYVCESVSICGTRFCILLSPPPTDRIHIGVKKYLQSQFSSLKVSRSWKQNFWAADSPKKQTNSSQDRKTNSFFHFWGESAAVQFCFEIYSPLVCADYSRTGESNPVCDNLKLPMKNYFSLTQILCQSELSNSRLE